MIKFIPLMLAGTVCLFMLQSLGRTLYVDHYEFWPAATEWHEAHSRGDQAGMKRAREKEWRAHERTFDPFWFVSYWR